MKHLYAHALIHAYEKFRVKNFYVDRLFCFEKLRSIFFDELSDYILDIKSFYFHIREYIMSKVLVFHDFFCNSSKSCKLSLEKYNCLLIELYDTIFYSFEITLYRCNWCPDLMREISEEVRSDLFLNRKRLMKCIDSRDKWCKFILSIIADIYIALSMNDIFYGISHYSYRSEDRLYPEEVPNKNKKNPYNIRKKDSFECACRESSFWRIFTNRAKIKSEKAIFSFIQKRNTNHRISR